jgi:CRP/FNR family transcriptional regulator, cyclic AMP receptor protein
MDTAVKEKLDGFFAKYKSIGFMKGEPIIEADEDPGGVFYLVDGIVKEYSVNQEGVEVVLNLFKPNAFFPMPWVLNRKPIPHYFEGMTDGKVYKAPADDFLKFLKENPDVMLDLLRRIYKGMEGMWQRLEYSMSGSAYGKFVTELLIFAKRFGKSENGKVIIDLKIFEKDLASQTGIARETVSRLIGKLKEKELLSFENNTVVINNLDNLEKELSL